MAREQMTPSAATKNNVIWHQAAVNRERRQAMNCHPSVNPWFINISSLYEKLLKLALKINTSEQSLEDSAELIPAMFTEKKDIIQ